MMDRITPGAFYGAAIAALCGLLMGLMLQQPWQKHPGGPRILLASAAAAELARPPSDDDRASASSEDPQAEGNVQLAALDATYNDPGYIPPDPLPVTRLDPDRFDVQPAADQIEREETQAAEFDTGIDEAETVDETRTADASRASAAPDFY
jgi:hypothetical protein